MYLNCASSVLLLCCCLIVERAVCPALRSIMRHVGSISGVKSGSITLISNPGSSGTPKPFCTYFILAVMHLMEEENVC